MELSLRDRVRRAEWLGLMAVIGVGLVLLWTVSSLIDGRARAAAQDQARIVTGSLVATRLVAADVNSPMSSRTGRIERAVDRELTPGLVGVGVRRFDGTVVLAAGEVHPGVVLDPSSSIARAFEGRVVSEVVTDTSGRRLIASYVPLALEGDGGHLNAVAEIYQDYGSVGAGFEVLRKTLVPILLISLVSLYLLLKRTWRTALVPEERVERGELQPIGSV